MKKVSIILGFTFLIIFLSSCLNTLHPIFTEKDLAYDPKLIGVWNTENQGNKGRAIISNLATENSVELPGNISTIKQKGYFISYQDKDGDTKQYIAFLARIGRPRRHAVLAQQLGQRQLERCRQLEQRLRGRRKCGEQRNPARDRAG